MSCDAALPLPCFCLRGDITSCAVRHMTHTPLWACLSVGLFCFFYFFTLYK
ncbi:hypothetical protein FKM82_024865 [Ascaphus truei]